MLKSIRNQWKAHPLAMTLLLMGYLIGILVVSIGTSVVQESRAYSLDAESGNPDHQLYLHLSSVLTPLPNVLELIPTFKKAAELAQLQVGLDRVEPEGMSNQDATVVGLMYSQRPEWEVPLIEGRHLTPEETLGSKRVAVVGRDIAKQLFSNGVGEKSSLTLQGATYQVVGVVGRETRSTQWDELVYVPLASAPAPQNGSKRQQLMVALTENGASPAGVAQQIQVDMQKIDPQVLVSFETPAPGPRKNSGQFTNSLKITVILAGSILLISSINIANLSLFWVMDRRREIGLRKALGASDGEILRLILAEMMSIALVAAPLALVLHLLCVSTLAKMGVAVGVHWLNWALSFGVAILCGGLSSLTPVRAALRMEPADILRMD